MAYKKFTASEDMLKPDPAVQQQAGQQIHQLIDVGRQKDPSLRSCFTAPWIRSPRRSRDVPPLELFETAINNIKPYVEVRSRRVGGANYQVPMQVNKRRQQSLAFRWLIGACREGGGRPMADRLADELMAAFRKEGKAMQTRENTHRMADANKAFAHFAW